MEPTCATSVIRVEGSLSRPVEDQLVREQRVALRLRGRDILVAPCTPGRLHELAVGHLVSQGCVPSADDVAVFAIDEGASTVCVDVATPFATTQGEPRVVESSFATSAASVAEAAREAEAQGKLFRATGGTHLAAVCPADGPHVVVEDISRTCALEKALGGALLAGVDLDRSILFLTSRVPKAFVRKAARVGIPIIAAVSAPTFEAVQEAERLGVCLCGFVRGSRMNVYSRASRVGL